MKVLYICAAVLLLAGCGPSIIAGGYSGDGYKSPTLDVGGTVKLYLERARYAREHGLVVEIRGSCDSACLLKLASGENLCVHPLAMFGVHEVRTFREGRSYASPRDAYRDGIRDAASTEKFREALPQCAAALFSKYGTFNSGTATYFLGQEILDACPTIKKCT